VEKPDTPAATSRPHREHQLENLLTHPRIPHRWIEAEAIVTERAGRQKATRVDDAVMTGLMAGRLGA